MNYGKEGNSRNFSSTDDSRYTVLIILLVIIQMIMCCVQVTIPEKVDLLISEPLGYMLYNERMVESYLHAKKWLKSGGKFDYTLVKLEVECNISIFEFKIGLHDCL